MGCSVPAGAWSSAYGRPAEPRHRAALGAIPALLTCSSSPSQPCWNSRIHSQDEEEPSEHLLHLIPQRQSTPKADTPSDNRQQSGLLWQPVEGLMLLSSIRKGKKKEDRGEKKQNHHHQTNPKPNHKPPPPNPRTKPAGDTSQHSDPCPLGSSKLPIPHLSVSLLRRCGLSVGTKRTP